MKEIQNENILPQDHGKVKKLCSAREVCRKDVRILAWQFFNILRPPPISLNYTSNKSSNSLPILIGDIAWHKKNKTSTTVIEGVSEIGNSAPALVICLKRYGFKDGHPFRKDTPIDIPEEIFLPHLIDDESVDEYDQTQSFKLVLMAVVCHRGKSLNGGHYTTLVRRSAPISTGDSISTRKLSNTSQPPHYARDQWCKFDDLSNPRVFPVNFEQAILAEMPYLLFYQIQPQFQENSVTSDCTKSDQDPPSYDSGIALTPTASNPSHSSETRRKNSKEQEYVASQSSEAMEFGELLEKNGNSRLTDDYTNTSGPTAQILRPKSPTKTSHATEATTKTRLSRAASRFTKGSLRSRPSSQTGESRISATISRLSLMRSKEQLRRSELIKERQNNDEFVLSQIPLVIDENSVNPASDETQDFFKKKRDHKRHRSLGYSTRKDHDLHSVEITDEKSKLKDTERDKECKIM
jgi:hypothetical protein